MIPFSFLFSSGNIQDVQSFAASFINILYLKLRTETINTTLCVFCLYINTYIIPTLQGMRVLQDNTTTFLYDRGYIDGIRAGAQLIRLLTWDADTIKVKA